MEGEKKKRIISEVIRTQKDPYGVPPLHNATMKYKLTKSPKGES